MKYIKINKSGSITLPDEVLKGFPIATELALWWKGDSLILKRVSPFNPSSFAERVTAKEMPLGKIAKEVHKHRKEKRDV